MPQNLELKVSIASLADAERTAKKLGARFVTTLHQKDTYYRVPSGRLKLRELRNDHSELIYYQRPNTRGGKYSQYTVFTVGDPKTIHQMLAGALGIKVVVEKQRRLYLLENARLHIDRVKGLGIFLEFEVMLEHGKTQARILFQRLCKAFNIQQADSLRYSYSDLLLKMEKKKSLK